MNGALIVAAAAAALFRVVPLACTGDRLAIAGGGVLRLAEGATCAAVVPGRALTIAIGDDGRAAPQGEPPAPGAATPLPAAQIPRTAFVLAPAANGDADQTALVTVQIAVTVPARTPPTDDIYVSTERSNWSPSEVRMDRVDARHFRLTLQLHRGARVAFRITRGSAATMERDASRALPKAHIVSGEPNARIDVDVAAWADID
jgi:hypothetical protein